MTAPVFAAAMGFYLGGVIVYLWLITPLAGDGPEELRRARLRNRRAWEEATSWREGEKETGEGKPTGPHS